VCCQSKDPLQMFDHHQMVAIHAKHGTIYICLYSLTATNFSDARIEVHFESLKYFWPECNQ